MRPFLSSVLRLTPIRHAFVLLALGGLLAACDRHSAAEVPESYGHGSSHEKSYTDHEIDTRTGSHSFSDSQGIEGGKEGKSVAAEPTATPVGTEAPGRFFPNGN